MQKMRSFHRVVWLLVVLGLVTARISPACAFISGQSVSFIEICTSQGIEKVAVTDDRNSASQPGQSHHKTASQCDFCFSAQTGKTLTVDFIVADLPTSFVQIAGYAVQNSSFHSLTARRAMARAPPVFS